MLQIDPWERAAECERALQTADDPTRREILTDVRKLWMGLANARSFFTKAEFDEQVEAISYRSDQVRNDQNLSLKNELKRSEACRMWSISTRFNSPQEVLWAGTPDR